MIEKKIDVHSFVTFYSNIYFDANKKKKIYFGLTFIEMKKNNLIPKLKCSFCYKFFVQIFSHYVLK